ncbi:CAP domain-containing protein [Apilactobacillus micheneri]|uniref:CAP domain-containing protein n=1 Tax=Apilactobacillus micheneri TaxID=1899430 RepID=UPI00112CEA35|nr:CAP domain-containing protein [Apilactobacillus micheneri]TPR41260.1 CAP domain-containing protein [Apilactobacillus micheneri]
MFKRKYFFITFFSVLLLITTFSINSSANTKEYIGKKNNTKVYHFSKNRKKLLNISYMKNAKNIKLNKHLKFHHNIYAYSKRHKAFFKLSDLKVYKSHKKIEKKPDIIKDGFNYTSGKIVDWNTYHDIVIKKAFAMLNNLRIQKGLNPLKYNNILDKIANIRAIQEAKRLGKTDDITHYNKNGVAYSDILAKKYLPDSYGLGENLATSDYPVGATEDAEDLTNEFIGEGPENNNGKEHGHYENMVDKDYSSVGIGFSVYTKKSGFKCEVLSQDFQ